MNIIYSVKISYRHWINDIERGEEKMKRLVLTICMISILGWQDAGTAPSWTKDKNVPPLTAEVVDALRREGGYDRPPLTPFMTEGYERNPEQVVPFGTYRTWDRPYNENIGKVPFKSGNRLQQPYKFRTGGVGRGRLYGPDEFGRLYAENRILYHDGLGNGLLESLRISKKYGLSLYFYASDFDGRFTTGSPTNIPGSNPIPFLKSKWPVYVRDFTAMCEKQREYLKWLESFSGLNMLNNPEQIWLVFVGIDTNILQFFLDEGWKDYDAVNQEFRDEHGYDIPITVDMNQTENQVKRIRFWLWLYKRYGEMQLLRTRIFREVVTDRGIIATNIHGGTTLDWELFGKAFDYPGTAPRPMMCRGQLAWENWMGYLTLLLNDLTNKAPMISARINLGRARSKIIPTPDVVRYWHSQVVQGGAVGFYFWLRDFSSTPGHPTSQTFENTDESTLPKLRWETSMDIAGKLGRANVFVPPASETGILVSTVGNTVEQEGWKKVFSAYCELKQAKVWSRFISDREVESGGGSLDDYKVVYVPRLKFVTKNAAQKLLDYVRAGGTVVTSDPEICSVEIDGRNIRSIREDLVGPLQAKALQTLPPIRMNDGYQSMSIMPAWKSYAVEARGSEVIGTYPDGKPAVLSRKVGKGQVILLGGGLMTSYLDNDATIKTIDASGSTAFYKAVEKNHNILDRSWVWDVTVDNVHEVTGKADIEEIVPDESIQFRWHQTPRMP